jgi:hypothetical protein
MAGKIEIPEELKHDLPQSKWSKILLSTPIVMTVIATMLAGLASSEMTKAQYNRSLGAQLQSKAGDQWGYFQAKKLRATILHNSLDMLVATSAVRPLTAEALPGQDAATIAALTKTELPAATPAKFDESVTAALGVIEAAKPESEISAALGKVEDATLTEALAAAKEAATVFDNNTKSVNKAVDKLDESLIRGEQGAFRDFTAARLRYASARYDNEARLNAAIGGIYELQVRKSNLTAEKYHKRSGKFFFGMLAAQLAVIVSTFAIAARKKSLLWSLAAAAGAAAVSFSVFVYLRV